MATVYYKNGTSYTQLTATDVGASSSSHTHTPANIGAATSGHTHATYLPLSGGTCTGNVAISHGSTPTFTIKNTSGSSVSLVLDRNTNAGWRWCDDGGNLYLQTNWVGGKLGTWTTIQTTAYETGYTTFANRIKISSSAGSWVSGMTIDNASVAISTVQTQSSYHKYLSVKNYANHVFNIGGLGDEFGFYCYKAGRTENGYDSKLVINASTGVVSGNGGGLTSLNASNLASGTVAIARGGTGASDAATARSNLGITLANLGAAASSHSHSYLPLTGGSLTGNLTVNRTAAAGEADINCQSVAGRIYFYSAGAATGNRGIWLVNNAGTSVGLLTVSQDHTVSTDRLWHYSISTYAKSTSGDVTTAPTSANIYGTCFGFKDKNNVVTGYTRVNYYTNGLTGIQMEATRTISGTAKYCNVSTYIAKDGTLSYSVSSSAAFRNALGLGNTSGALPVANGGTGTTAKGTTLLSNIGITSGTGAAPASGTAGTIYIQYA